MQLQDVFDGGPPFFFFSFLFFEIEGQQTNAQAQEAINHLASFLSSREEISQPGIEPPTSSSKLKYLSIIIQWFRVASYQGPPLRGIPLLQVIWNDLYLRLWSGPTRKWLEEFLG